jgi:lipoprotein signal peptidase
MTNPPRPVLLGLGVALLALAADALTKAWARSALRGGHQITVTGGLIRLRLVANHGAAGNLLDRLTQPPRPLHGAVTDWIHVWFYGPTFNLADVWLRGGVLIAAACWLWTRRRRPSLTR